MTTHVEDVITGVGLLIGGDVEAGGNGTFPVTNTARPAEVVLEAPSTSPAQLDRAVEAAVEAGGLARLLTSEHGKTQLESVFDTATMCGMGGWRRSVFGVEVSTEGVQAFARQRVQVRRLGPVEQGPTS